MNSSTFLTGLVSQQSMSELFTITKTIELSILFIAGLAAAYILPKIPYWFDKWIDRLIVLDFDEETKKEFSNIIRWMVYVLVLYLAFYILGFTLIHTNPLFQIVLLFFGIKVAIAALRPSIKKIDRQMSDLDIAEGSILMKILVIGVYVIGLFIALTIFGLKGALTTALAGAGVFGLVIGFGAKDIVANTLSGLFIAIDKPFSVGDTIEVKGETGAVTDMGLRTTEIEKFDNRVVTLPNSYLANNAVVNYTANNLRRISLKTGISYDSDLGEAMKTLKNSLILIDEVYEGKEPDILLDEFEDSAIVLEGRFWIDQDRKSVAKAGSHAKEKVLEDFREQGIEMPYPHVVVVQD